MTILLGLELLVNSAKAARQYCRSIVKY